jgi:predicted site-specific integrase-resolvase
MNFHGTYLRAAEAAKHFGVHPITLRRWANENRIDFKKTNGGQRVYNISNKQSSIESKDKIIYARVSSYKQKDDLERQITYLKSINPSYKLVKDIGSGINFKRKGFLSIIEKACRGQLEEVVVASKDRLCRFGFDLVKWIFEQNHVKLLVLDKQNDKSPEVEFTEDILAILQVFACRWNGKRRYTVKNKKNQVTIDINTKENISKME